MKHFILFSFSLRSNATRVARKERGLTNVLETQIQHDDALESHSSSGVRRAAVSKRVNVSEESKKKK